MDELSYLLITPYSLNKSRTGGMMARLLSRTDLDLVGAQMLAPTKEFAERYAALIRSSMSASDPTSGELIAQYIEQNFPPHDGRHQRVLTLLFKGKDACQKIYSMAGRLWHSTMTGETIRDTYADYVVNHDGSVRYFEPAVLTAPSRELSLERLRLFADFADSRPNIVDDKLLGVEDSTERTLVIIKPDNWRYPSSRPGNIIDMFSKTGLRIVGCKIYQMSVAEAMEFYGPVKTALREKLAPRIGAKARELFEKEFEIKLRPDDETELTRTVGTAFADDQFSQLVAFMSGKRPEECDPKSLDSHGGVKSMILVYQGTDAVKKIRDVLGPTDPTKAPGGTIRRDFGTDVMVNTAHASDSSESFARERKIVKLDKNRLSSIIKDYLKKAVSGA